VVKLRALVAGLRPATLLVTAVDGIAEGDGLAQLLGRSPQDAREALIDERHAHPSGGCGFGQRRDERGVGYDEAGAHRMREAKQALQPDRLAQEERHRACALRPSLVAVQDLACAGQSRAQLLALVMRAFAGLDV